MVRVGPEDVTAAAPIPRGADLARRPRTWDGVGLAAFLLVSLAAAVVGLRSRGADPHGYLESLPLPASTPSAGAMATAWTLLYLLAGVSAFLVWRRWGWRDSGGALGLWLLQLALTVAWTPVFLALEDPGLALVVAMLATIAALSTVTAFHARSRPAAWLLVPYGLWVAYLTGLTGIAWWRLA